LLFAVSAFKINDYVNAYFKTTSVGGTPLLFTTTANTTALYETTSGGSSDYRFNYLFNLYGSGYSSTKYWQDDIAAGSNFEQLRNNIPIIRLSEIYYIAAECTPNVVDGVGYLNTVRTNRGLTALPTTTTAATLESEILKEYKKETYAEGQLFYYFKRKNTARVDGSTINMTDATWTFPLPENEVEFAKRF
jgi:starch-binding outer membrane protein, SusD/RagB family